MSRPLLPIASGREAAALCRTLLLRRRWPLAVALVAFAVSGLAGLVAPFQLGRLVDVTSRGGDTAAVLAPALWILVAALVGAVGAAVSVAALAAAAEPALAELREEVLDRALHVDDDVLERAGDGDLLSRVGDDVRLVAGTLTDAVPLLVGSVVTIGFTAVGLVALDWRLGLAGLATVPAYWLALRWYLPRSGPLYRREREANGERAQALLTGVHGARTLRAFGLEAAQREQVSAASWRAAAISIDVFGLLTRFGSRNNRAEAVGLVLVLGTGFFLVRGDLVTVGAVTAAALYFHRLFNPIGAVLMLFDDAQSAGASLTRLAGLALLPRTPAPAAPPRAGPAAVTVRGLHHEYVAGRVALDRVDLEVAAGERVAVVGASGAGKTTLGLAVAGRLAPTAGEVRVGGHPTAYGAAGSVLHVSQEVHVFAGSVRDNVLLARPGAADDEVERALAAVGAGPWVAALPDGLDTAVGEGAATALTPARAQQLALARVVLADPPVVVLDEATAEAGSAGARDLDAAALAATAGRTAVVIAHRLAQARTADRILVLHRGAVTELGTHAELLAAGGRYADLWRTWSGAGPRVTFNENDSL